MVAGFKIGAETERAEVTHADEVDLTSMLIDVLRRRGHDFEVVHGVCEDGLDGDVVEIPHFERGAEHCTIIAAEDGS